MSAKIPVRRSCLICGVVVVVNPSRAKKFKVCSKPCWGKLLSKKMVGNKYRVGKKPSFSFAPGHTPWNKDKKGIHLSPASEFKKGMKSINHLPVGQLVIRTDKNGTKRRWIKIAEPNRWTEYAKWVWVHRGGRSIPRGLLVHHVNGNALDDRFENLQLVTRSEHINLHRKQLEAAHPDPNWRSRIHEKIREKKCTECRRKFMAKGTWRQKCERCKAREGVAA